MAMIAWLARPAPAPLDDSCRRETELVIVGVLH